MPFLAGKLVLGGRTGALEPLAQKHGVELVDYFAREELAVLNAGPPPRGRWNWPWPSCPPPFMARGC